MVDSILHSSCINLYAYKAGSYDDHAHKGAELAGSILRELNFGRDDIWREEDSMCNTR